MSAIIKLRIARIVGTTRTEQGAETLRALGSEAVIVDVFDAEALSRAVLAVQPKIIIHQLTGLSAWKAGCIEEAITENARVRTEGTRISSKRRWPQQRDG